MANIYSLDVLREVDRKFREKYEIGFEEFERALELLMEYGFHNHEYFDKLIDDYVVWRRYKMQAALWLEKK